MTTPSATAQSQPEAAVDAPFDRMSITISLNGPYLVNGGVPLTQEVITPVGGHREYRTARAFPHQETYALCRWLPRRGNRVARVVRGARRHLPWPRGDAVR